MKTYSELVDCSSFVFTDKEKGAAKAVGKCLDGLTYREIIHVLEAVKDCVDDTAILQGGD